MSLRPALALAVVLLAAPHAGSGAPPPRQALFDNTHAETAGQGDWIIDDQQPLPVPDQSKVTAATGEAFWTGGISAWGIALVQRGYRVATLTSAYGITYRNPRNPYDLSKYDVFIVCEPNTRFTSAESTAIFHYVQDGGGLVAVVDHNHSDRNNDGFDSPRILNLLDRQHFFGAHFDTTGEADNNIIQTSGNVDSAPDDSIVHGAVGVGDSIEFHNGTTMTLDPAANPAVRGNFWMSGRAHGHTGVMVARSVYGNGRLFWVTDSSPADDGTGQSGNRLYPGWGKEASGRDSIVFMNGTIWATRRSPLAGARARTR